MISEEDLYAAARTIRTMSSTTLNQRYSRLLAERQQQTDFTTASQDTDLDSTQLDEAAYQLGCQYHGLGRLTDAARWYRAAALNDYADAALQLGYVLEASAERYLDSPASPPAEREELNLVVEAARWYAEALGAGYFEEAADRVDPLISRHDPTRPRPSPSNAAATPAAEPARCPQGGLQVVNQQCAVEVAAEHIRHCTACQQELLDHGGMLPARAPSSTEPGRLSRSTWSGRTGRPAPQPHGRACRPTADSATPR